ncbi:MAG: sigma 54-interacting transcriptional regulator, partial [Acidobacteriota bacterium]
DISRAADLNIPVLIRGATGTGKELVAQALHRASSRRDSPFVAINLGAVTPTLAAAELFGVVKGAFTGAERKRKGCFERARGGTLFLDEIGEAPGEVQASLLRALETGSFLPVGGEAETAFDARVVAATDADLESAISAEGFRAPLLHRLGGYEIHLPALAERRDDMGRLLVHFLSQELMALGEGDLIEAFGSLERPWLPAKLVARLARFDWPGNVRQLRNVARRLVIEGRHRARLEWSPQVDKLVGSPAVSAGEASTRSAAAQLDPLPLTSQLQAEGKTASGSENAVEAQSLETLCLVTHIAWNRLGDPLEPDSIKALRSRVVGGLRRLLRERRGFEVADFDDSLVLIFGRPLDAIGWALEYQELLLGLSEGHDSVSLTGRASIHLAELGVRRNTEAEIARGARRVELVEDAATKRALGLAAQVLKCTTEKQILLTRNAFDLAQQALVSGERLADPAIHWLRHGVFRLPSSPHGSLLQKALLQNALLQNAQPEAVEIFEVGHRDIAPFTIDLSPSERSTIVYRSPAEIDEDEMIEALRAHAFNLQSAADFLGISRPSLYKLIAKSSRVRKASDLSADEIARCRSEHGPDLAVVAERLEVSRRALRRRMTELGLE